MPQGVLPHLISRCLALRQVWATWLNERIHHLSHKTAPWLQGVRPLDVNHRIQRPRDKKEATIESLGLKKAPPCSLHRRDKTACCLWR